MFWRKKKKTEEELAVGEAKKLFESAKSKRRPRRGIPTRREDIGKINPQIVNRGGRGSHG